MNSITNAEMLKIAIQQLKDEQAIRGQLLKEQFFITYDSLKPAKILLDTIKDITTAPGLIGNILGSVIGLTTGYASKKLVVGASTSLIRNFLGSALQFGLTNFISKNSGKIKNVGQNIFGIFNKKEPKTSKVL